ncbi:Mce-associated membrane protein [Williamsia limnetica]|uniref:Mce-associated membrane protein n=1 Tax=Williamsia limnetica TaxID=882452 RepID=A0A318RG66_WILLI|nr:hypothetical protein [Williamsia limnetica]PYE15832.1 Mce-associated membrane protein [Williamsia limnetica]
MADNDVPETADPGTEPSEGVSVSKRPTGKSRKKPADSASDAPTMEAAAPASSAGSAKPGKQITINVSSVGKIVAGALVVALIAVAIFFGLKWKSDSDELVAAADAKQASDYFVTQLLNSMNTASASEYVDTMSPLTTGQFRDNLVSERDKTQADITQMQLKITPDIWSSGVVSNTEDSATTLVIAEISGTSSVATQPVTNVGMFRLTLEKHDGKWLVSQMDPGPSSTGVGSDPAAPGGEAPAPVPTEPAPAPAPAG